MVYYTYETDGMNKIQVDEAKNPTKIILINKGCDFIQDLIYNCFKLILKYKTETTRMISDSAAFSLAFNEFHEIRIALFKIEKVYANHYFRKIAYQLNPYFDILEEKLMNESTKGDFLIRFISLLVNVLYYYSLEYCYPPKYSLLYLINCTWILWVQRALSMTNLEIFYQPSIEQRVWN